MVLPHWGYQAALSTLLLWLFLNSGVCVGQEIKGSMYSSSLCLGKARKVLWLSEKSSAIITGKSYPGSRTQCKIIFGLASNNGDARLRIHVDFMYFHDCNVRLQINQSSSSYFNKTDSNKEMFLSGCYGKSPRVLYAYPKNYVLLSLSKTDVKQQAYNFRLNISVAEKLPASGPPLHTVIIVSFVCVVLVITVAVLLLKYAIRMSYHWDDQRREQAMTRAINLYNSSEPLEEPDMVYIQPGGSASSSSQSAGGGQRGARPKHNVPEIAFVHSDGRIERFRPLGENIDSIGATGGAAATIPAQRPKPQKSRLSISESEKPQHSPRGQVTKLKPIEPPDYFPLEYYSPQSSSQTKSRAEYAETASLGGIDLPPSYEDALHMPPPESEEGSIIDEASLHFRNTDEHFASGNSGIGDYINNCDIRTGIGDSGGQRIQTTSAVGRRQNRNLNNHQPEQQAAQDLVELSPDSASYMNIGGRLEILNQDPGEVEDVASRDNASQQPLLQPLSPK